jgi:hypothetical protein
MCGFCRDCIYYKAYVTKGQQWGVCELAYSATTFDPMPLDRDALAYAYDPEGTFAELRVRPTFGCVSFEPKD